MSLENDFSTRILASLTPQGEICITVVPRKSELCPISYAVENALPLQYMIFLCWQDTVNADKKHIPIYGESLQHSIAHTATSLKIRGQQGNRKLHWY